MSSTLVSHQPQTQPCSAPSQPQAGPQLHCGGRAIAGAPVSQPHWQLAPGQLLQLHWAFIALFMENSFINKWLCRRTGLSDTGIVRIGRALHLNERADLRGEGFNP